MANHIQGPLYYEKMGRSGPPIVFVHPNPMDQSCWLYQMAHLSTWYQCMAIDLPGYGRSPKCEPGVTKYDLAEACWEAVDDAGLSGQPAVLVGCSAGSSVAPHMFHVRPDQTAALVLSGTGYTPAGEPGIGPKRINDYTTRGGLDFRFDFTHQDLSPAFRTTPMAHYFANLFTERNAFADLDSIIYMFQAPAAEEGFYAGITCPTTILTGSEDNAHQRAFLLKEQIPGCELKVLPGAGHACMMEQPWLFDKFMLEFLDKNGLFPGMPKRLEFALA